MDQLIGGTYLLQHSVIHRGLKPANILIKLLALNFLTIIQKELN